jgi:hypothetical protein
MEFNDHVYSVLGQLHTVLLMVLIFRNKNALYAGIILYVTTKLFFVLYKLLTTLMRPQ